MEIPVSPPLNDIQISLLKIFSRKMSTEQTLRLKQVLMTHYEEMLQEEVAQNIQEKGLKDSDFEALLNKQQRSS